MTRKIVDINPLVHIYYIYGHLFKVKGPEIRELGKHADIIIKNNGEVIKERNVLYTCHVVSRIQEVGLEYILEYNLKTEAEAAHLIEDIKDRYNESTTYLTFKNTVN